MEVSTKANKGRCIMNPLQDFELNEISEQPGNRPQFEINDMNSLNWAFRKIAALKSQD
ncbi:hypothetical protein [Bacillus altitudinis]|uniref:hypothetical protein n=1 Tax=Bacillus altitudinis TaxID=293387 RepID=UPI0039A22BC0